MGELSALGMLLDSSRLRQLQKSYTDSVERFVTDDAPDRELLSLVEEPFRSMEDVHDRLERLEATLLEQSDRRAVFLTIYTEMTAATIREIETGAFIDPAWMERYLVQFAEYYRRAFYSYERGAVDEVPDPWIVAFGTALQRDALVMQDTLLGINAHINYDLALTLSDIGLDPDRPDKFADHTRINEILRRLVSVQQDLLARQYAPGLAGIGDRLGELDDLAAAVSLRTARKQAWQIAVLRTDVEWLPVDRFTRWLLARSTTGSAYLLLEPTASQATMETLHEIEANEFDLAAHALEFHDLVQDRL